MTRLNHRRGGVFKSMLIALLSAAAGIALLLAYKMHWHVQVGEPLPGMTLKSLAGDAVELTAFRGRIVVLNFFATWCTGCLLELEEVHRELWPRIKDNDDVVFVAVSRGETAGTVEAFVRKKGYEWTFVIDEGGQAFEQLAWSGIPRTLILDRDGLIRYRRMGYRRGMTAELLTELKKLKQAAQDSAAIQARDPGA